MLPMPLEKGKKAGSPVCPKTPFRLGARLESPRWPPVRPFPLRLKKTLSHYRPAECGNSNPFHVSNLQSVIRTHLRVSSAFSIEYGQIAVCAEGTPSKSEV